MAGLRADRPAFAGKQEITFPDQEKPNPNEEMAFPDEEKRNAREEITFPDQEKPNPNETADYSRCGAGNPPLDNQRSIITTDIGLTHHGTGRPK